MNQKKKPSALGRGLSALISSPAVPVTKPGQPRITRPVARAKTPAAPKETPNASTGVSSNAALKIEPEPISDSTSKDVQYLDIKLISNNPNQPRQNFNKQELAELSDSIKTLGVLQPVLVRPAAAGKFEIVAGERRWRAAQLAKLTELPVIIKVLDDRATLEIALVENVQRSNLNPLEEAHAYQRLIKEFSLSQQEVADRVGKDRATVANFVRLLKLPEQVLTMLSESKITMGHAKAILTVKEPAAQISLGEKVIAENLSVRALEAIVSRVVVLDPKSKKKKRGKASQATVAFPEVCDKLRKTLGTKVNIKHHNSGRGRIEIDYFSESELDRLVEQLTG